MRRRRYVLYFLSLLMILSIVSACLPSPKETEATTQATETTTAATTLPNETEPDDEDQDPVGEAELIWTFAYEDEDFSPRCVAVHPDGELVIMGAYLSTYTQRLFDGEVVDVDSDYRHGVDKMDISPDGNTLAAGLTAFGVWLTRTETEEEREQLHGGYNNTVAFSPDGSYLATGNRDGAIWLWSTEDWEQVASLSDGERSFLWDLSYHPSGGIIASLQWRDEGVVNVWDIEKEEIIFTTTLDILVGSTHKPMMFSPDGELFAAYVRVDRQDKVRFWSADGFEPLFEVDLDKGVRSISFSPDSSMLAIASIHDAVTIWDTTTGDLLYVLDQAIEWSDGTHDLAFTPDGGHIVVLRNEKSLELWRLPDADPLEEPDIDIFQPIPIPGDVLFDTGSSNLKIEADEILANLAEELFDALPKAKLTFVGHTDSRGDASANMVLSIDRATAVRNWFETWADANHVDGWIFEVEGKGETELKVPDVDGEGNFRAEAGRMNRRVEINVEPIS